MKKLIAILCAVAVLATSLFGALVFTAVAEEAVTPEVEEVLVDELTMPTLVDDFGREINVPTSLENIPASVLSHSSTLNSNIVENTAGLPFQSLYAISGGANDRETVGSVTVGQKQQLVNGNKGFMFYVEVPEMDEYTYENSAGATKTSTKFHMSLRADIFDTSDGRKEQFYVYAGGMTIWTLGENDASWKALSMVGYGIDIESGFKGYLYVPFTNLNQTGYIAEDDIFLGYTWCELTASNNYYQNSAATTPLKGYIPAGKSLVLSPAVLVAGAFDTNTSGDEDGAINGLDNVLPPAEVVITKGARYSYKRGLVVDYTDINYPSVTTAFTAINDFSSVTNANYNISSITPLLPESAYSHYRATSRALASGDVMENVTYNSYYLFGQNIALSFSGGWVVYVDFSQMTQADGTGAEEMFTAWVRGAKEDGSSAAAAGIVYATANDNTAPYYYLADGANAWVSKTLIDNDTATATYGTTEASDSLILPNGFKGYVYFPNKLMRSNMNYSSGKTFKSMSFTVYDTDSVGKSYKISAPIYVSAFDASSIYAQGSNSQLVNLSTNEFVEPVGPAFNEPDVFPYDSSLVDIKGDVMSLAPMTDATRNSKHVISSSGTFIGYTANGYTATFVGNNTVFSDDMVRVTGSDTATTSGVDMLEMYYASHLVADIDGYMLYIRNDSETALRFAIQPYTRKVGGGTNYTQVSATLDFLSQVDGKWQWTEKKVISGYTYELAPGEGGFLYLDNADLFNGESYDYMKIRTSSTANYPTTDVNFVASAPYAVNNFTKDAAGMAFINKATVPQDLLSGEFTVPNDYDGSFTSNLLDLVQAKTEASDYKTFRDSYLTNYVNAAEYEPVLSNVFSLSPLEYVIGDSSTVLSDNPDRGYRSEIVLYFSSRPLTIAEAGDYTPELLKGTGYTVDVSANAIYDSYIANGTREHEVETDYDVAFAPNGNASHSDQYPFGDGSGGAVHTVTVDLLKAWIKAHNDYVQARVTAGDGAYNVGQKLTQSSGETLNDFYSRAARHLVSNYMEYELRQPAMMVSELTKVVYLNDDQKAQVNYTGGDWTDKNYTIDGVERYIRIEGNASQKNFFYYDTTGTRVYEDDGVTLKALKIHVYHDPRTIFGSDENNTAEWTQRLAKLFRQYKIGYDDVNKKTYYTKRVVYADGSSSTIPIVNKLFNAYLSFYEFAYKADGSGNTTPMPDNVMAALDYFLEYTAMKGAKANLRPSYGVYTENAYLNQNVTGYQQFRNNVEYFSADEATMIAHIKQMAPVIAENKGAIHNISSGWIGFGGEMAAGFQYPAVSYKNVITAILDEHCIPNGLYFSSRSSTYIYNIVNGVATNNSYNGGNLDMKGLAADAEWAEKYAKWCGFNNDAFFGEQLFPGWNSSSYNLNADWTDLSDTWKRDTANAYLAPNDGELYTNGSHVPGSLVIRDGKYVWVGFNDTESGGPSAQYNDTDNMVPTPIEAILELAHHRYTDFSQWHGFLDENTPNVMTFWMDHNAEWIFEGDVDSIEGNNGYFNAEERAAELTAPITKEMLDANGIVYDPAWFSSGGTRNAYEFIRDHLGYRLVAQNASVNYNATQSPKIEVSVDLKNYGFAAAFNMESVIAILDENGNVVQQIAAGDPSTWYSVAPDYYTVNRTTSALGDVLTHTVSAQFDPLTKAGKYYIAIKLVNTVGTSARFANDITFNENGYNILGSFKTEAMSNKETRKSIKVMSYNIRCLRGGESGAGTAALTEEQTAQTIKNFKALLNSENPDVMIVCENRMYFDGTATGDTGTLNVYEMLFQQYFPYAYNLTTGASAPRIYSKYPLSNIEYIVVDYGDSSVGRRPLTASITVGGEQIWIVACHPEAGAEVYESKRIPYFQAIVDFAADKENVIIAGDLNTDTTDFRAELNCFRDAGFTLGNFGDFGTYQTYRYGSLASDKHLDNILVKGLEMQSFYVGKETYSDHFPIYSKIYLD